MMRKLFVFMLALPTVVVAGSWTGLGVSYAGHAKNAAIAALANDASSLWITAIDFVSQLTEETWFLALGVCFILFALALHRRSARHSGR
jgi:hypothetical protein